MIFEWMSDPSAWVGLATQVVLEIVLAAKTFFLGNKNKAERQQPLLIEVHKLIKGFSV